MISDLAEIRARVRAGDFRADLLGRAQILQQHLAALKEVGDVDYFKGLSTVSEIYYYFAKFSEADKIVAEEGPKIVAELPQWHKPNSNAERAYMKQKVWVAVHYAQALYRSRMYVQTRHITEVCMRAVEGLLIDPDNPMYGTKSRLFFVLGQVLRQLQKYEESRDCYLQAIRLSYDRLGRLGPGNDASNEREQAAISRGIGLASALGLGWLDLVRGRLREAEAFIAIGRSLLLRTNDWVNKAYINLLYGSLQRLKAGYDSEKLQKAITILEGPYNDFAAHLPYRARAAHQLALAYFYRSDYEISMSYVEQVRKISEAIGDAWWLCNGLIMQSRIARKMHDLTAAVELADTALEKAQGAKEQLAEVDARIANGEAHLELKNYGLAEEQFKNASNLGGAANGQVRAVCHLHLANTYLKQDLLRDAEQHINAWSQLKSDVENEVVQDQGRRLEAEFKIRMSDFIVSRQVPTLNYDEHVKRLRDFLIDEARRRYGNRSTESVAKELGVTRQTIHNWLHQSK